MVNVKINGALHPATIAGKMMDRDWNDRESKAITLEMTAEEAKALFVDDVVWFIVYEATQEDGSVVTEEYDNSDYCLAGSVTDHRDGTVTVKMGKRTDGEMLAELMEVLNDEE